MANSERVRVILDLPPEVRRRARVAAARRDVTLQEYVRRALVRQLEHDGAEFLSGVDDPVLAELWSDPEDDVYDHL